MASRVVMYSTRWCPFCLFARRLLKKKGVDVEERRIDKDPALGREMVERTRRETVPQIFVGDFHVGGFDDLQTLDQTGELDQRLFPEGSE